MSKTIETIKHELACLYMGEAETANVIAKLRNFDEADYEYDYLTDGSNGFPVWSDEDKAEFPLAAVKNIANEFADEKQLSVRN